jgi:hypothetical protein
MLLRMHHRTPFTGGLVRYHSRSRWLVPRFTVWQSAPLDV